MGVIVRQRNDKTGWWAFVHHQGKRKEARLEQKRRHALRRTILCQVETF